MHCACYKMLANVFFLYIIEKKNQKIRTMNEPHLVPLKILNQTKKKEIRCNNMIKLPYL